jgi:hypothetical protein
MQLRSDISFFRRKVSPTFISQKSTNMKFSV